MDRARGGVYYCRVCAAHDRAAPHRRQPECVLCPESSSTAWKPRGHDYNAGALWRYAQNVGPASKGAVTHPGAKAETHVYADI